MSVIGPRPQLVRDMVFMTDTQRMRHNLKTGIIYPNDKMKSLYDCLVWAYENKNSIPSHSIVFGSPCIVKTKPGCYVTEGYINRKCMM